MTQVKLCQGKPLLLMAGVVQRLCTNTVMFGMQFFGKAASPPAAKPNVHSVMRCKVVTE